MHIHFGHFLNDSTQLHTFKKIKIKTTLQYFYAFSLALLNQVLFLLSVFIFVSSCGSTCFELPVTLLPVCLNFSTINLHLVFGTQNF